LDVGQKIEERKMAADKGHDSLIRDIENLLTNAKEFQYHDFRNDVYPMPKMALIQRLEWLVKNTKNGKYDNEV
jgi:hypothetical protein